MNNGNIYTEYNDEKNRIPWLRIILTALIIAIVIFIILLLLRNCGRPSLRGDLVRAAEEYYEKYPTSKPKEVGECYVVTLATLEKEGLIDPSKYDTCDKTKTYVNVCHLENDDYHYAATLSCSVETTKYDMWKDGDIEDLVDDSDVRFLFMGEQYTLVDESDSELVTKYYYPNDETDVEKVDRYYISVPATGYTEKEGQATGYKWYTESTVKSYWNNGAYSATAPSGYTSKDSQTTITKSSDKKPESASYRTIKETTLYRYRTVAVPYKFICVVPGTNSKTSPSIVSPNHCGLNDQGFTQVEKAYYTCDSGKTDVAFGTVCKKYTDWSSKKCTSSALNGIECETKKGYEYTDVVYKWYKTTTARKYYPSNSSSASKETTYFLTAPVSGAIKDTSTEAQVYKWYRVEGDNEANMVEKWVEVTNGYVSLQDLLTTFNNLGYPVNSLSDIRSIEDIRYQYKMQYRNVEE